MPTCSRISTVEPSLEPVLQRLGAEHQVIAEVLDRFDRTLVDLVYEEQGRALPARSGTAEIGELADELSVLLLSHLAYEEDELVGGLARMPGPIWVGAAEGQALDRSRIAAGPDYRSGTTGAGCPVSGRVSCWTPRPSAATEYRPR